jgi:hypothetical protein
MGKILDASDEIGFSGVRNIIRGSNYNLNKLYFVY